MEIYRVPKRKVEVTVRIPPREAALFSVFLSDYAESHQGEEAVSDLLAERNAFLPLLEEGVGVRLFHRNAIHWVRVPDPERVERHWMETTIGAPTCAVTLRCACGDELAGTVRLVGREGEQRLGDVINRERGFLHLEAADGHFLVNLARVTFVVPGAC